MDTIVAIATAPGIGGIGIVRMSGKDCFSILENIFVPKHKENIEQIKGYTMKYGQIISKETGTVIDEVLVSYFKAPKSYTTENMCEINFTLARKMPGDAPGDVFAVDDCAFWNGNAMALSSSLIHAGLKEISLFSLPPVAYTGGRYLKDILAALKKDLAYDVMTVSGVRRAKASVWAYWLGAAWFVCMYPDDEFSAPLSETFGEMLMTKPATAAEKTAKALACLKICRHVKDRAECLTVAEKLKDYAATLIGSDALLAYMCGLTGGKVDGVGSLGGLYRFAREKLPRVDGGFLSVMILENFAGITADGGEILLSPRFDGNIGKIRGRFFGKTMEFDFRKGEPSAALNGGKTSGRISAKGLGDRSFFSVGY